MSKGFLPLSFKFPNYKHKNTIHNEIKINVSFTHTSWSSFFCNWPE